MGFASLRLRGAKLNGLLSYKEAVIIFNAKSQSRKEKSRRPGGFALRNLDWPGTKKNRDRKFNGGHRMGLELYLPTR
ncbi:MAG: hypothetical protein JETCAE01_14010 [Anaerolineaceae bacterium]|nr:MAG: hypothetical protein JETCAE01_14010 [Anaerolineaceae bacterium]